MPTLTELYLQDNGGDVAKYHHGLNSGWRIGQAFFNALSSADQGRLVGTSNDPFYSISPAKVEETIGWLMNNPLKEE